MFLWSLILRRCPWVVRRVIRSSQGSAPESGRQASAPVLVGGPLLDSRSAASAVNVGASTSGLGSGSTFSVSFAEDGASEHTEDDRDPVKVSQESFQSVLRLLARLCPGLAAAGCEVLRL